MGAALAAAPAEAPVQILVFTDFECPFCGNLAPVLREAAQGYGSQVHVMIRHNPLSMHAHAMLAHRAAFAAAEQGRFLEMHDLLFSHQSHLDRADLLSYAAALSLDLGAFEKAMDSERAQSEINRDRAEAAALGATGTPTLFINGRKLTGTKTLEQLKSVIDAALGIAPEPAPGVKPESAPAIHLEGAVFRGAEQAPITIVGFTDLQCPFCGRAEPLLKEVERMYPGRVRLALKHFPLDFHKNALPAAEALEAAGAQGKFWEMHDLLFARQQSLSRASFDQAAKELGLDLARFDQELDSHRYMAKIEADRAEGERLGIDGTPTFFVNGRRVEGIKPLAEYAGLVRQELTRLKLPVEPASEMAEGENGPARNQYYNGNVDAPNTLVWFSDIQSGLAPQAASLVNELLSAYPNQIRVTLRHRPLENHLQAGLAHEALMAAGAQGRFWEMHSLLIAERKPWTDADLVGMAGRLKLNQSQFAAALQSHQYRSAVEQDLNDARRAEIRGTPVFFLNGKRIDGLQPLSVFKQYLEQDAKPGLAQPQGVKAEGERKTGQV